MAFDQIKIFRLAQSDPHDLECEVNRWLTENERLTIVDISLVAVPARPNVHSIPNVLALVRYRE